MAIDKGSEVTTKLLTLLNVSATKVGKRKWSSEVSRPSEKLNKRRVVAFTEPISEKNATEDVIGDTQEEVQKGDDVKMKGPSGDTEEEDLVEGQTEGEY